MFGSKAKPVTLVTGGSGHVGANLVRALLKRGEERVRCLVRRGSNNTALDGLDVELVYGDLRHKPSLEAAMKDVSYLYHLAAFVSYVDIAGRMGR